ncbi:MAG: DNA helicase-2/ATP-dependent DNA helicase PcrA [Planctomycetota bacterium]
MNEILSKLNPEQRRAVETIEGPLLVLAGAGTGKTRVITVRIAYLLSQGVPPEAILAMTFTNKAAKEMRERVSELVGSKLAERLTVGTFHSFCLRILRENAEHIGFAAGISIADSADQIAACKSVLRELHIAEASIKPSSLQSRISLLKNKLVTPEQFAAQPGDEFDHLVALGYKRYEEFMRRSRRMDFDDLLTYTVKLLRENEFVRGAMQLRYRYLLVDEYQDTNEPQYAIVHEISKQHRNLCVVGDDDQSIYSWRGADIKKILNFGEHYPEANTVTLETNYRSTQEILDAANRVIVNNPTRHAKTLRAHAGTGELVQLVMHQDESVEAEYVIRDLRMRVDAGKSRFGDFAILFRTAIQPRPFEAELRARGVPYVLIGGMSFFDRKEVRDVLAYLKVIQNPKDEVSLLRIVNCPPRGVGKTTLDRVLKFATEQGISVPEAFQRADEIEKINRNAVESVQRLQDKLQKLGEQKPKEDLVKFIEEMIEIFAYRSEVERCYPNPEDQDKRWKAVTQIISQAQRHVARRKQPGLANFLNEMTLTPSDDDKDEAGSRNQVTLMTLHASKGLEYPRVYLIGLEEGILPHSKSVEQDTVEEERRLMYVGITRAREGLVLSHTLERQKYGTQVKVHPSRFIYELKGSPPPEDWIPAGKIDELPLEKRAKKRKASKRRRKKSSR